MPRGGRKFEPTEQQRKTALAMAGYGIPQDDIAYAVGCDPKTLRKYFGHELRQGSIAATAKVAESLFNQAVGIYERDAAGQIVRVIQAPVPSCGMFWMKCRADWSEKVQVNLNHKHQGNVDVNLRGATDAELAEALDQIQERERAADKARTVAQAVPAGVGKLVH